MLITHARQLRLGVAHGFVTADHSMDCHLAFGLQLRDTRTRVAQLACILFSFKLSLSVLACGAIAFAREALSLLRQTLERRFELSCNFANSFRDRSLRQQFSA